MGNDYYSELKICDELLHDQMKDKLTLTKADGKTGSDVKHRLDLILIRYSSVMDQTLSTVLNGDLEVAQDN